MMDSVQVMEIFADTTYITELGFTPDNFISLLLPDTYQFYWTINPKEFFNRMKREYDKFWTKERMQKAADLGVTPQELSIVASITEEETNDRSERGTVGRLYLNRVKRKMLLQADPTVKFAMKNFALRRVLNEHLKYDSPYNTYMYGGLPPGPIRIPTKQTIDYILNSTPHNYIYMCAKEDFSGKHNFATNYRDHERNAAKYRRALNNRGIK